MEGLVPRIVVLAIGAAVLGGPEALHFLLTIARQSPLADIAICVFFIGVVTTHVLGVVLLERFVRKARAQPGAGGGEAPRPRAPPATDYFAKITLTVSVGVAFTVTACLVVASGALSSVHFVFVLVIGAAGYLTSNTMSPLRAFHEAGNAGGPVPVTRAGMTSTAWYLTGAGGLALVGICLVLFISYFEPGVLDALSLFHGFTNTFVGVGAATVVGTVLLALISLRPRDAAGTGSVPSPATSAERFGRLRQNASLLAFICIALVGVFSVIQYASGRKMDGRKGACPA